MSGRDITAVIGQNTYYEAVGTKRSFNDGNNDVDAYLVKITKADDKSREGKFALIRSTKHAGDQPSGDKYVTDITYGEQCDLLNQLNTPKKVTLSTRTFDGTAPVDNPNKAGTKQPTETTTNKEWDLKANETEWKGLGASMPSTVTKACSAKPPGAAGSAPAVSKTDLGEVNADDANAKIDIKFDKPIVAANADESISVKVNGQDKSLAKGAYTIAGDTLSINKAGIDALGITNTTAANKLIVNADQIADAADTTKKNVATGELALQAKAPGAAGSAPAVSKTDLGEVNADDANAKIDIKFDKPIVAANADESISVKVNGQDKSLAKGAYTIAGDTLSINKAGIDALGITNTTAANKLIVNADQIADAADTTKKNVATGELALQAKAPAAAPDANPTANITTPPASKFSKTGPIELTFENPIQLATGKALDDSTIGIYEVDAAGTVKRDTKQTGLQYKFKGNKLTITRPPNSELTPGTKYRIVIASDILLNDDRKAANGASITYDFKAITPKK